MSTSKTTRSAAATPQASARGGEPLKRILLIEDEADIQLILRLALERLASLEVEICGSGEEALVRVPEFKPQLILLDVMMPGLDGFETLARLRRIPEVAATPVVFLTARAQQDEVEECYALGALRVIVKPFDPLTLSESIRQAWEEHSRR